MNIMNNPYAFADAEEGFEWKFESSKKDDEKDSKNLPRLVKIKPEIQ